MHFGQVFNYSCVRANVHLHKKLLIINVVEENTGCFPNSIIGSQTDKP